MKNKTIVSCFLICSTFSSIFAQKEVYFSNKSIDSVSISGCQGIHVSTYIYGFDSNMPLGFGYFNELKLGSETSLILSGNIYATQSVKSITPVFDQNGYFFKNNTTYNFDIMADIQIEPRWYLNYKNRTMKGKNVKLNSGWYLSLPVIFTTTPLINYYQFGINWKITPSFGYRYAFSNQLFVEGNINLGISPIYTHIAFVSPFFNFKAAYTFK